MKKLVILLGLLLFCSELAFSAETILAKDTDNIAAKLAVATMQAMQPVVISLLDLIDGVKGDIEVEA